MNRSEEATAALLAENFRRNKKSENCYKMTQKSMKVVAKRKRLRGAFLSLVGEHLAERGWVMLPVDEMFFFFSDGFLGTVGKINAGALREGVDMLRLSDVDVLSGESVDDTSLEDDVDER